PGAGSPPATAPVSVATSRSAKPARVRLPPDSSRQAAPASASSGDGASPAPTASIPQTPGCRQRGSPARILPCTIRWLAVSVLHIRYTGQGSSIGGGHEPGKQRGGC